MYCASAAKCAAVLAGRTEEEEEEEEKPEKSLLIYANLFWVTVTFRAKFNNLFFCKLVVPGKPLSITTGKSGKINILLLQKLGEGDWLSKNN